MTAPPETESYQVAQRGGVDLWNHGGDPQVRVDVDGPLTINKARQLQYDLGVVIDHAAGMVRPS
jgi:hypothetical protein